MRYFAVLLVLLSSTPSAQEFNFDIDRKYLSQFGLESDLVSFIPLFKLTDDQIHNKKGSYEWVALPDNFDASKAAYGFVLFSGLESPVIENEITILVEDATQAELTIFIDRNGNLDFSDDGEPILISTKEVLSLENEDYKAAFYNYELGRSWVTEQNEARLRQRYQSQNPNGVILSANNWLTSMRLHLRVSYEMIYNEEITIMIADNNIDGVYTFQTDMYGDKILILEGHINLDRDLTSVMRQAEPIDHNAVFELFGINYFIKNMGIDGNQLTISETSKETKIVFSDGMDISSFTFDLINGGSKSVTQLLKDREFLLIDVGGTWCRGCIKQGPTIQRLYNEYNIEVMGVFDFDTIESVNKYVRSHSIKWPVALADDSFRELFRVSSFPTYIIVSKDGTIIQGDSDADKIEEFLENNT